MQHPIHKSGKNSDSAISRDTLVTLISPYPIVTVRWKA
jgi:hypothetical protein